MIVCYACGMRTLSYLAGFCCSAAALAAALAIPLAPFTWLLLTGLGAAPPTWAGLGLTWLATAGLSTLAVLGGAAVLARRASSRRASHSVRMRSLSQSSSSKGKSATGNPPP